MQKLVGMLATLAALAALLTGLVRGDALLIVLKRTFISYLVIYGVSTLLAVVFRTGVVDEGRSEEAVRTDSASRGRGRSAGA